MSMKSCQTANSRMTQRERLLAPFRGIVPDHPAWTADLTYWYEAAAANGTLADRYRTPAGFRQLHVDLGVCCYYVCGTSLFKCSEPEVESGWEEKDGIRRNWWRTPKGTLTDRWRYLPEAHCWAHEEYAVKEPADFAALKFILEQRRCEQNYEAFRTEDELIGEAGLPIAAMPRSPLPALLADWCGVERTIYLAMDVPDLVAEVMDAINRANDPAVEIVLNSPAVLFHFCDNLDSSASTPFFETYMRDYYQRRLAQVHGAGKYAVVHLDGRVRGLIGKLAACGFDGVESITPDPAGDVSIEETRALSGRKDIVLWGGVPGAMFAPPWREGDVCKQTRRVVESWGGEGKVIVGSADQVPPNGNIDFCRAIAQTVQRL